MGLSASKPDPSRSKEVIGAGYSHTGTVSMALALQKLLDGPVHHGGSFIVDRADKDYSKNAGEALLARRKGDHERAKKLMKRELDGYVACTDMVNCLFVPELLELYPDAKVVLATRDPEKWWASFGGVNMKFADSPILPMPMWASPAFRWFPRLLREWHFRDQGLGGGTPEKPLDLGPDLLELHNQWVIKIVPKDRLLIMHVEDGWEPLCRFLGKPVPDEPFPAENDAASADAVAKSIVLKLMLRWVAILSTGAAVTYMATKYWHLAPQYLAAWK